MNANSNLAREVATLLAPFLHRLVGTDDTAAVKANDNKIGEDYGVRAARLWYKLRPWVEKKPDLAIAIQQLAKARGHMEEKKAELSFYLEKIMKNLPLETIAEIRNIVAEAKSDTLFFSDTSSVAVGGSVSGNNLITTGDQSSAKTSDTEFFACISWNGEPDINSSAHFAFEEDTCCAPDDSFPRYRYLNTFFAEHAGASTIPPNKPLISGQKYFLCVEVNPERKGLGDDDQPFPDQALPPEVWDNVSHLPLTVVASSRDFEIDSRDQVLYLPQEAPSSTLKFALTPKISSGYGRIMVEVFYRGYLLQAKQVEALVILQPVPQLPTSPRPAQTARTTYTINQLEWEHLSLLPERLLTIEVERDPKDESLDFRFLDRTKEDRKLAFFDTHLQPEAISQPISGIRHQLKLMVTGQNDVEGYEWKLIGDKKLLNTWLPPLANAGHSFQRALLPKGDNQVTELAAALQPGTVIQVNPVFGLATLPWALLYDREVKYIPGKTEVCDEFVKCEQDCANCSNANDPYVVCPYAFWGYRYAIEQLPCWVGESSPLPHALIFEINNNRPISMNFNVYNKFLLWRDHLSKIQRAAQIEIHTAEVVDEMEKIWKDQGASLDLVYFYCHGGVDEILRLPYLELSDSKIDSNFLEASNLKWEHNPLVFLNGCATGDYGPESYVSLISDFLKGGACGVVGTECSVPELFAEAYAASILTKFFQGKPLGQAMLEVSLELLKKNMNPLGLVYTLYAYNRISLVTPVSQETSSGDAK
ncbi:MAG: CHAT domain-containing protein [Methanosarcinales archaeon]|nr:CHAT domain-containing protein [Methanosarcinales archaeon]